jgi:hypothetical protein
MSIAVQLSSVNMKIGATTNQVHSANYYTTEVSFGRQSSTDRQIRKSLIKLLYLFAPNPNTRIHEQEWSFLDQSQVKIYQSNVLRLCLART